MFTIVPLTIGVSTLAMSSASQKPGGAAPSKETTNIWAAAAGDLAAIERHMASGAAVDAGSRTRRDAVAMGIGHRTVRGHRAAHRSGR